MGFTVWTKLQESVGLQEREALKGAAGGWLRPCGWRAVWATQRDITAQVRQEAVLLPAPAMELGDAFQAFLDLFFQESLSWGERWQQEINSNSSFSCLWSLCRSNQQLVLLPLESAH